MNEQRIKALEARYNRLATRSDGIVTGPMRKIARELRHERRGEHVA